MLSTDGQRRAVEEGRLELSHALHAENRTERYLRVVAAVELALADLRLRPVIVGGLAVEYWTGSYNTYDIDVLLPSSEEVAHRLEALGFQREGRVWELPGTDVVWEMPGDFLGDLDATTEIALPGGGKVLMLRLEDILVHRIEEYVATGNLDVAQQAIALLLHPRIDEARLHHRAAASGHVQAVQAVRELAERVQKGDRLQTDELHVIAQRLLSEWGHNA